MITPAVSTLTFRACQLAAIGAAMNAIQSGKPSGLWAIPTGAGKTIAALEFARRLGWKVLVLVHRDELVRQWIEAVWLVWPGAKAGIIKGDLDEWQDRQDVVIASVQSLHSKRLQQIPRNRFGLVIADEAHHVPAISWTAILDHFESRFVLGVTATPERADGQGLADRFGSKPLYAYPLRSAIEDGILCRLTQYAIETTASLDSVSTRLGDFAVNELAQAVNTPARNRVVVEAFEQHAPDRRAIAFTVDVQHAVDLSKAFTDAGIPSAFVSGTMALDERRDTLERFRRGDIRVVANCAILTEGFDDPGVDAILMARPTKSRPLYIQCVGRGLRKLDGKPDCLVVDFTDNARRHKLITCTDLFGTPKLRNAGGADVVEFVDSDARAQEAACTIESLHPLKWRLTRVCPWPAMPNLQGYVASEFWHGQPASEKQVAFIRGLGLEVGRSLTKGEASYLIDRSMEFRASFPDPPSPKMAWCLQRAGLWHDGLTFDEARVMIGRLKSGQLQEAIA